MRRDTDEANGLASPSVRRGRAALGVLVALLASGVGLARSEAGTWPAQCATAAGTDAGMTAASEACDCADVVDCDAAADAGAMRKGTYNIVVIVGDDQGYCQYGFMHGYCKNSGELCRTNIDCCKANPAACAQDANALCVSNRDPADGPLRLSDWTCRYRQPPSKKTKTKACEGVLKQSGDKDGESGAFPFDHSSYPCPHTTTETYQKNPDAGFVSHPVSLTPTLDRLASTGVVFTHVHAQGNSCKPSRGAMTHGMHHRHMKSISARPETIAAWVGDVDVENEYVRILWGKGEVVSETQGGYQDGVSGNGPKTGRYNCGDDPDDPHRVECYTAVKTAENDVARILSGADPPALVYPDIPPEARRGQAGMERMFDRVFQQPAGTSTLIQSDGVAIEGASKGQCTAAGGKCTSKWNAPFFLWYAPKQPHKGGAGDSYLSLYDALGKKTRQHFARVTQVDAAVGALEDELKRSCVCLEHPDGTRQAESLLENTVIFYFADHGFLLPESKRNPTENNHRGVLIISDPRHRAGTAPHRLYEYELASTIDILQTVIDYAGGLDTPAPLFPKHPIVEGGEGKDARGYLFARNLKPFVNGNESELRQVHYGEEADEGVATSDNRPRYLIPRPGNVGLCFENNNPRMTDAVQLRSGLSFPHVKLCAASTDCACAAGSTCECRKWSGPASLDGKRCVNNPGRACANHSECDPSYDPASQTFACPNGTCGFDAAKGSLADFAPDQAMDAWDHGTVPAGGFAARTCTGTNRCVFPTSGAAEDLGLCQPVILKLEVDGNGENPHAWDLNWDPDQKRNLLSDDADYLGGLKAKLLACLSEFHALNGSGRWVPPATPNCPWPETDPL